MLGYKTASWLPTLACYTLTSTSGYDTRISTSEYTTLTLLQTPEYGAPNMGTFAWV